MQYNRFAPLPILLVLAVSVITGVSAVPFTVSPQAVVAHTGIGFVSLNCQTMPGYLTGWCYIHPGEDSPECLSLPGTLSILNAPDILVESGSDDTMTTLKINTTEQAAGALVSCLAIGYQGGRYTFTASNEVSVTFVDNGESLGDISQNEGPVSVIVNSCQLRLGCNVPDSYFQAWALKSADSTVPLFPDDFGVEEAVEKFGFSVERQPSGNSTLLISLQEQTTRNFTIWCRATDRKDRFRIEKSREVSVRLNGGLCRNTTAVAFLTIDPGAVEATTGFIKSTTGVIDSTGNLRTAGGVIYVQNNPYNDVSPTFKNHPFKVLLFFLLAVAFKE